MSALLRQYQKGIFIKLIRIFVLIVAHVLMSALLRQFILKSEYFKSKKLRAVLINMALFYLGLYRDFSIIS
jgi:hypothetical protein